MVYLVLLTNTINLLNYYSIKCNVLLLTLLQRQDPLIGEHRPCPEQLHLM